MDSKNMIIAVLSITAVALFCTLVLMHNSTGSIAWADTVDRGGDYVLVTGAFSENNEALYAIDGANDLQILLYIIIPLIRVVFVNLLILSWIGKMVQFALVWVTTRGGPVHFTETIATYVQKRAFEWRTLDLGYPSALAVLWFLVVFIGALILNRLLQAEEIIEY